MSTDDIIGLVCGLLALAVLVSWPVLPGTRRLAPFKTFPPFRAWEARPHPDAVVDVEAGRRLDLPRGGTDTANATVIIRTAWTNQDTRDPSPSLRVSRPLVPLVSVDGVPASWGWGVTKLTLPPGEHLISVSTSHSRCYQMIDVECGERRDLDYASIIGATAHHYSEAGHMLRDRTSFRERRRGPGVVGWVYLMTIGGLVLMSLLMAAVLAGPDEAPDAIGGFAVFGAIAVGLGVGVAVIVRSLIKQRRQSRARVAEAPMSGDPHAPRVRDADAPERLVPAPGWAGFGLHLRFEIEEYAPAALEELSGGGRLSLMQRWRAIRIGEPEVPACRPWIPVPEVYLDGRAIKASWTRMWMQIAPGEHDLFVRVNMPHSQIDSQTAIDVSRAEYRRRIVATEGQTIEMRLTTEVSAVPQREQPRLAAYRAILR